eukprot:COSAG02_NODE_596_length_19794_cov_14.707591_17_plen_53_part_00
MGRGAVCPCLAKLLLSWQILLRWRVEEEEEEEEQEREEVELGFVLNVASGLN